MNYLRAQVAIAAMRYNLASISATTISTRKNLGFLVGAIVTIIGCVIVMRGVRQSEISLDAQATGKANVLVSGRGQPPWSLSISAASIFGRCTD